MSHDGIDILTLLLSSLSEGLEPVIDNDEMWRQARAFAEDTGWEIIREEQQGTVYGTTFQGEYQELIIPRPSDYVK